MPPTHFGFLVPYALMCLLRFREVSLGEINKCVMNNDAPVPAAAMTTGPPGTVGVFGKLQ